VFLALLRLTPLGDVPDRARDQAAFGVGQEAEIGLDGEPDTVGAEPEQFAAVPHALDPGPGEEVGEPVGVGAAEFRRHQHVDRLAHHVGARVAEHALGLGVHQHDALVDVGDHHGVGCGLDQVAKAGLAGADLLAQALDLGEGGPLEDQTPEREGQAEAGRPGHGPSAASLTAEL